MPALGKEETRGLVGPSMDRVSEAGVGTLAVLPWASRSIFLAPGKGTLSYTRAKGQNHGACFFHLLFHSTPVLLGFCTFESRLDHLGDDLKAAPPHQEK